MLTACIVTGLSWGCSDVTHNGYISAGNTTFVTTESGFHIATIDADSCSITSKVNFDTTHRRTDSIDMANYINGLPMSTILIGVTADDPFYYLEANGRAALNNIGANVRGLVYFGKVAFVAQIGLPSATVLRIAPPGGDNLPISASIPGNASLQSLTLCVFGVTLCQHFTECNYCCIALT